MKKSFFPAAVLAALAISCNGNIPDPGPGTEPGVQEPLSLAELAGIFSSLPLEKEHLQEVYDAVNSSSGNGYDEEYTLENLILNPGRGVGDSGTKADIRAYRNPLRNLLSESLAREYASGGTKAGAWTKAGMRSADEILKALSESDYQLYFPYSDQWDGESYPIITFDPGMGAESNYGYEISIDESGARIVDSVYVDEAVAQRRPVWVLNNNDDSAFTPLELFLEQQSANAAAVTGNSAAPSGSDAAISESAAAVSENAAIPSGYGGAAMEAVAGGTRSSVNRRLLLKSFKMLRNYDSWFGGASEFMIKLGGVENFTASTEAELKLYTPTVTDLMIVVKRKQLGETIPYDAILLSDFTSQLEKLVFLVTEDDGGTRTSWKCEATVKVQSKSYGFTLDLPLNDKDDIVWRGQLAASFFQREDVVTGRFGDVVIQFELD